MPGYSVSQSLAVEFMILKKCIENPVGVVSGLGQVNVSGWAQLFRPMLSIIGIIWHNACKQLLTTCCLQCTLVSCIAVLFNCILLIIIVFIVELKLMTHWPVSDASFQRLFLAPETGSSHLVPVTMTHFAGKWYQQNQNKNEFCFWEFWGWWHFSCCFSIHVVEKIQKKSN